MSKTFQVDVKKHIVDYGELSEKEKENLRDENRKDLFDYMVANGFIKTEELSLNGKAGITLFSYAYLNKE